MNSLPSSSTSVSRDSLNCFWLARDSRYIASFGEDPTENTNSIVIAQQYLDCCLLIRCSGSVFTETLPRNRCLFWLHYPGFQSSCHNMYHCGPSATGFLDVSHSMVYRIWYVLEIGTVFALRWTDILYETYTEFLNTEKKKLSGFHSARELNRPSDRRLSATLVPTFFADRGCRVVSATDSHGR
jgi:hypothetical protein